LPVASNTNNQTFDLPMPEPSCTETNAVIAFKNGLSHPLHEIHSTYYPALCHFATGLLDDLPAAEEIVTEIFVTLWKKRGDFETPENVKAFLYISTRNACLNYVRKVQRDSTMKSGFLHYLSSDHEGFVLNEIIREEVLHEVYTAIETLPYQCRRIFKMCYVEGMSNSEIAERSHLSVHTVKNHKVRAIGLLRLKFLEGCL
jgi:RNA polymerase sigma-70 factor (family 1)